MYYYIAESSVTAADRQRLDEIKSLLSQLGIAGEFAVASPARSVEEHLQLAFAKGFTTVVGIGSDALASKVAATLHWQRYERAVLGLIPLQPKQLIWSMVGARNLAELGEALRTRRVLPIDLLELGDNRALITPAASHLDRPVRFQLIYQQAQLQGQLTDLSLTPDGRVELSDATFGRSSGLWQRFFGRPAPTQTALTRFRADRWQLATEGPISLMVGSQEVATSPLNVKRRPKALKLIISRAKITPEKADSPTKEPVSPKN